MINNDKKMINNDKKMINNDKKMINENFPFPVSYYLKYLIHKNIIDLYDEKLEEFNKLLEDFRYECDSHEECMKVINYTISRINHLKITNFLSFLRVSLYNNLKNYRKLQEV